MSREVTLSRASAGASQQSDEDILFFVLTPRTRMAYYSHSKQEPGLQELQTRIR